MPEYLVWEKWLKHLWRFALCVVFHLKTPFCYNGSQIPVFLTIKKCMPINSAMTTGIPAR